MTTQRHPARPRRRPVGTAAAAGALLFAVGLSGTASADSVDGIFPTADEVGGEVFPKGVQVGDPFPTDWDLYDLNGQRQDVAKVLDGRRTVLAFFISAVPVSVEELKKLQGAFSEQGDTQMLFVNADQVGTALTGGNRVQETARTVRVIQREEGIRLPMFVAPNDALSPGGLSNKIGFRGLPTVFVIDAQGRVENVYVGPQDWSKTRV